MWVLGYIQRIIRAPHCANLMHSDLVLCHDERPMASQALMRHAWRDRAYPGACEAVLAPLARLSLPAWYGFMLLSDRHAESRDASPTAGSETTPSRHRRCPCLAHALPTPASHRHVGRHNVPALLMLRLAGCPLHPAYSMGMEGSTGGGRKASKPLLD